MKNLPRRAGVSNEFFNMVYAVLLGESQGPRLGSFIAIYGLEETQALIDKALAGELLRESNDALPVRRNQVSEAGDAKQS